MGKMLAHGAQNFKLQRRFPAMLPASESIARREEKWVVCRESEIGVVEDIEEICSRLKRKPLAEFELPPQPSNQLAPRRIRAGRSVRDFLGQVRWAHW